MIRKYAIRSCREFPKSQAAVRIRTSVAASRPTSVSTSRFPSGVASKTSMGKVKPFGWKSARRYTTTADSM